MIIAVNSLVELSNMKWNFTSKQFHWIKCTTFFTRVRSSCVPILLFCVVERHDGTYHGLTERLRRGRRTPSRFGSLRHRRFECKCSTPLGLSLRAYRCCENLSSSISHQEHRRRGISSIRDESRVILPFSSSIHGEKALMMMDMESNSNGLMSILSVLAYRFEWHPFYCCIQCHAFPAKWRVHPHYSRHVSPSFFYMTFYPIVFLFCFLWCGRMTTTQHLFWYLLVHTPQSSSSSSAPFHTKTAWMRYLYTHKHSMDSILLQSKEFYKQELKCSFFTSFLLLIGAPHFLVGWLHGASRSDWKWPNFSRRSPHRSNRWREV